MKKYYLFTILFSISCTQKGNVVELAEQFSELECKAIILKDKRYALADRLREIELDTVTNRKELDSLNKIIILTKQESLFLADSIKAQLDDLFTHHLKDPSDREAFNNHLRKIIETKGCIHH
jgi:hypothetical protein